MFKNLRQVLTDKGITMKAYAEFLGVTEKTLQNKMNGITEFTYGEVERTSKFLLPQYRVDYLFARTRTEARQIVDHKHILVNGKVVNIPSYSVKAGDVITVSEKAKNKAGQRFKDIIEVTDGRVVPAWLESNKEALSGTVKEYPTREMIDVPVNEVLIVELYSK